MLVAQGVSPEAEKLGVCSPAPHLPPPTAAEDEGRTRGDPSSCPRVDTRSYPYTAPLGLTLYPELTLGIMLRPSEKAEL